MESKRKKVFITGISGMLGAHCADLIISRTDWDILGLVRESSDLDLIPSSSRIQFLKGELSDLSFYKDELMDCNFVVHTAAVIQAGSQQEERMNLVNVSGTGELMDVCIEVGIDNVIHVSSVSALGREKSGLISEEDHFVEHELNSPYAVSKYKADQEAYRARAEGLKVNIVRPSLILGSGQWKSGSDTLVAKAEKNSNVYSTGGTGVVDVRDVAQLILDLLQKDLLQQDVICSGHNVSFLNFQTAIAEALGQAPPEKGIKRSSIFWILLWDKIRSLGDSKRSILSKNSLLRSMNNYFYKNDLSLHLMSKPYTEFSQTMEQWVENYKYWKSTGEKKRMPVN